MRRIRTWKQFARNVRKDSPDLLCQLTLFHDAVLVTGCQRSGTTALASVISTSNGMLNHSVGEDDELTAALILSGELNVKHDGRYCFQTTYLNERYVDYYKHINDHYKIIWVIRNPFSVIYSMLHNWGNFAFNELFISCGYPMLSDDDKKNYRYFGRLSISRVRRACMCYIGKCQQLLELDKKFGNEKILIVDYDDLVKEKDQFLTKIFKFINLPFEASYREKLHRKSVNKANRLTKKEVDTIEKYCVSVYRQVKNLTLE